MQRMAVNDYEFITKWRVDGTVEEVYDTISDAEGLARWWPSVYLSAMIVDAGDHDGIGKVVDLHTKGFLPYTLRWSMTITEADRKRGHISLDAHGDFEGAGIWTLVQDGNTVDITYDWRIRADKPLLKNLSFAMKPFFAANHRWAMAKGLESLKLELLRRRATSSAELEAVPSPPPATTVDPKAAAVVGGGVLAAVAAVIIGAVVKRRKRDN